MNISKKRTLSLALLAVMSGAVTTQLSTSAVLAQTVDPQSLISQQPVAQPDPVAPAQVPPSPDAPAAVPATTPPLTGQTPVSGSIQMPQPAPEVGVPGVAGFPTQQSDPGVLRLQQEAEDHAARIARLTASSADESTILREVSRYQARLSLLNIASKVEAAQQQMAANRAKFQVEQAKIISELAASQQPAAIAGGASANVAAAGQTQGQTQEQAEMNPYTLVGVSSFGQRTLAQISGPAGTQLVEAGAMLGDGYRVSRITSDSVVLTHKGRRHTLYLSPMPTAAGAGSAQAKGSVNTR